MTLLRKTVIASLVTLAGMFPLAGSAKAQFKTNKKPFAEAKKPFAQQGGQATVNEPVGRPGDPSMLGGELWCGDENLKGYDKLSFRFYKNGKVVMIDAKDTVDGTYAVTADNKVTLVFWQNVAYAGQLQGDKLSGWATDGQRNWQWKVTLQKIGQPAPAKAPNLDQAPKKQESAPAAKPADRVRVLIDQLKTGNSGERKAAAEELGPMGKDAVAALPWLIAVAGQNTATPYELFAKRVDPSRVAACRAIKEIDATKLEGAMRQAQGCVNSLYVQIWARQSLSNLSGTTSETPAQAPKRFKELKGQMKTIN